MEAQRLLGEASADIALVGQRKENETGQSAQGESKPERKDMLALAIAVFLVLLAFFLLAFQRFFSGQNKVLGYDFSKKPVIKKI